ncbi:MAG: aminoglycoside 6-adenylyltransferase [Clostridiales bacterium]|nr:aminoglycoside 6-adenylyltransferase [Clostridiales bacterium]
MRTQETVIDSILDFANACEDVVIVMMNGSRVNPEVKKDLMQDYDIVFFIDGDDFEKYKADRHWIRQFGETIIVQQNDFDENSYIFLMQFADGVRIDLRFSRRIAYESVLAEDTLNVILLDKTESLQPLPPPSDEKHRIERPSQDDWEKLLNNAWWIQTYVAKGIWRDELPYAKYMFDVILMNDIRRLLSWKIGAENHWQVNLGKCGKFLKRFSDERDYQSFTALYPSADYEDLWVKLFQAGQLIHEIGVPLAEKLDYPYPFDEDRKVTAFIQAVKETAPDAKAIGENGLRNRFQKNTGLSFHGTEIIVRRPQIEEQERVLDFFKCVLEDTFEKNGLSHMTDTLISEIEDKKRCLFQDFESEGESRYFLIAVAGETILGSIEYGPSNDLIGTCTQGVLSDCFEIGTVFVHPDYQKNGLGEHLLKALFSEMKRVGISEFCLDSGYPIAQKIWLRRFGTPAYHLKDYWGKGADHMIWLIKTETETK